MDFTQGADNDSWTVTAGSITYSSSEGAEFTISEEGDSPTIETSWYFFFGRIEVWMKAAPGTGIVSSAVLESDDLDEIDWEWIGGVDDQVQTNYFGKGNTTVYDRGGTTNVSAVQAVSHNYTIDWTAERTVWYVDGTAIRTLLYADALAGQNYPQTPMRVKIGIWAGGDPDNSAGTIEWAGGQTDYADGPFTMTVQNVTVYNDNPAGSYVYGDQTGSYTSIDIDAANVTESAASSDADSNTTATSSTGKSSTATSTGKSSTATSTSSSNASSTKSSSTAVVTSAGSSRLDHLSLLPGLAAVLAAFYLL